MDKRFYDVCYSILSHFLHFPDVADTWKDITDGQDYQYNFPQNEFDFQRKRPEIAEYIRKMRDNNIIDAYKEGYNPLLLVAAPSGKSLLLANPEELYNNLASEIQRLICKGIHQIIKHLTPSLDDNILTAELVQEDTTTLQKYGLIARGQ